MKKILIAIPTARYIEPDTFKSIYDQIIPDGYVAEFQCFYGYRVDQVRNLIADWVVRGYDFLFAVDHDVTFPPDTIKRMIAHDKDLVAGVYRQRIEPQAIEIYDLNQVRMTVEQLYTQPNDLVPIGGCGFGCVLAKKEVFRSIGYPQFEYHVALDHANTISEDTDFCRKAMNRGFTLWCDRTILCGHIGSTTMHVQVPQINRVEARLRELHNQPLLPKQHVEYLWKMKSDGIEPKVIYDIGACVLHWTNRAKEVWPDAAVIPFEAMKEVEFLYREAGFNNFAVGCVLSEKTGDVVEFYENLEHPGGNSLFKENPELSPLANELFPEDKKVTRKTNSLDDIVKLNNLPQPDLIKMDVQGAELSVLKGAKKTLEKCNHLILELQHKDYNYGAPKSQEVIDYLESIGFRVVGYGMFCGSELGVDGDYHFVRESFSS
jgi:FkbM family methyltransferase